MRPSVLRKRLPVGIDLEFVRRVCQPAQFLTVRPHAEEIGELLAAGPNEHKEPAVGGVCRSELIWPRFSDPGFAGTVRIHREEITARLEPATAVDDPRPVG